jgi:hypothetical protein
MFNSISEIKKWISDYLNNKGKSSLHVAINNSKEIKRNIINFTSFLPEETKINQRCFHILEDLKEIPLCKECGVNTVNFNNRNKEWRYLDFCSTTCGSNNKTTQDKLKNTHIKKFGVDNYAKTKEYRKRMILNNNEKYGVDWYQQSEDHKIKSIATCLKKYGFDSYTKTHEFKEKVKDICLERYGVDWYSKTDEFKEKYKSKSLEIYGTEHPMLNEEFKKKVSSTIKEKYGKDWYNLTDEFKEYCFKFKEENYGHPIIGFKLKEYKLPSGKIIKVQGYENFALDIIFEKYKEEDVLITYSDIKNEIGLINYLMEEKNRIYLPDIYIKSENKIIEVKSDYTYNLELEKNILKKESCLSIGFNFEFWIIDKKGKLLDIK